MAVEEGEGHDDGGSVADDLPVVQVGDHLGKVRVQVQVGDCAGAGANLAE